MPSREERVSLEQWVGLQEAAAWGRTRLRAGWPPCYLARAGVTHRTGPA